MTHRTRIRYRFEPRTIEPDTDPDAPPVTHLYRCVSEDEDGAVCGAESARQEKEETAQQWTFAHAKAHPDHLSYAYAPSLPYRMTATTGTGTGL